MYNMLVLYYRTLTYYGIRFSESLFHLFAIQPISMSMSYLYQYKCITRHLLIVLKNDLKNNVNTLVR